MAGRQDPLRERVYAEKLSARIPTSQIQIYDPRGHLPHIECAELFNEHTMTFLTKHPALGPGGRRT